MYTNLFVLVDVLNILYLILYCRNMYWYSEGKRIVEHAAQISRLKLPSTRLGNILKL